jgi:hypothetical protein
LWKLVADKNFKLEDLSKIATRLYQYAEKAQNAYVLLATKFPKSKIIMRYYARFCYDVRENLNGRNYI